MKVYTCNKFTGYWPVGSAAVVAAPNQEIAAEILNAELKVMGLPADANADDMVLFYHEIIHCRILCDGNY